MIHLTSQNYNSREIIQNMFSPLVGVITSPLADEVCRRNNLAFAELLQPFSKLPTDAHFRDTSGTSVSIRGLRLNFCDMDWRPPQTVLARKMLNEAVSNFADEKTKLVSAGLMNVEVPTSEPWFEHWRETFLTVQFPADHEFTRHFLSCIIVLSSNDSNIMDTAHKLTQRVQQMQSVTPQKLPKWFNPSDVLNSYVVLHEGSQGDLSRAQQGYELLKSTFGDSKCFLIQINSLDGSVVSEIPDYWTPYIKRQLKSETQTEQSCGVKTPQDSVSVIAMPTMQMSTLTEAAVTNVSDPSKCHPLSPVQEHATEAINSKFSVSSESLSSQSINPNIWASEMDFDSPCGLCLNTMDVDNLRHFVQDYVVRALIPYVEHLVATLTETLTNKKGVSKSLLSVTKRWFVTSKPGAGASTQSAVIYTNESAELQTRKLGDLYFMFGHYNLAYQAYHQAKRDFNADSAWQYYAGALEMAAVSAFMLGTSNRKTYDYMEDAIVCYLTVCKLQQFATRATLLSMECLKTARLYAEASKQLIRMTSEESDLRSALLLEQAAYCFLATQPSMYRKYAFHIVLSGNRYSRAGQRKHAYRCYRQAYQIFFQRDWGLAEDHIQYTMAKQAYILKKLEEASSSYAHLLRSGSQQPAHQQMSFIKEYIQTQNELIKRQSELELLPHALPQVEQDSLRVLVAAAASIGDLMYVPASNINIKSDLLDEPIWQKVEEMIVITAASNKPVVFKPTQNLFTKQNIAKEIPLAVQSEPIELVVTLSNPLKCGINLTDIDLLWELTLEHNEVLSNTCLYGEYCDDISIKTAVSAAIKTTCSQSVFLGECTKTTLYFKLTPKLTGSLNIIGIVGQIALSAEPNFALLGSLRFEQKHVRNIGKQSAQTLLDNKLTIKIIPAVPALNVSFTKVPEDLMAGEIVPVTMSLRNTGIVPLEEIYLGYECPRWITLCESNEAELPINLLSTMQEFYKEKLSKDKEIRRQHVFRLPQHGRQFALQPQETITIPMWLQAPFIKNEFTMRILVYYSLPENPKINIKYRLVRHKWRFNVHECLRSDVTAVVSNTITKELGLNVSVKNENCSHHPLDVELYLNALTLYCPQYRLNKDKFYLMNQMEISSGQLGDRCLKSSKSASFQCRLENVDTPLQTYRNIQQMLQHYLSSIDILPTNNPIVSNMLNLDEQHRFLIKHEALFLKPNITTDEFNHILNKVDSHLTVTLSWSAVVTQNSAQRIAFGQNFVQLRRLYESVTCPRELQLLLQPAESAQLISEFSMLKSTHQTVQTNSSMNNLEAGDFWESNDHFEGKCCLLDDENFFLAVKG